MKNGKFEVGDIVCGKKNRLYCITDESMTKGKIVSMVNGLLDIEIIEYDGNQEEIGAIYYELEPKYFDLVESVSKTALISNPYTITTDMATFVKITHNNNTAKSKCDVRYDKFDIHTGIDIAMERLEEMEKPKEIETPKYVRMLINTCGLKKGDVTKVLSCGAEFHNYLYVKTPIQGDFIGNCAKNPESLKGNTFTYITSDKYEPVTVYE